LETPSKDLQPERGLTSALVSPMTASWLCAIEALYSIEALCSIEALSAVEAMRGAALARASAAARQVAARAGGAQVRCTV
jgi:hypothetical protein